ncbi:hypothetical protein BASA62_007641 [Batrachochytrium salamandrivorans]|nr:hypothetical protein BASA62_007641 [Batrachochytrium salamandrivorans]
MSPNLGWVFSNCCSALLFALIFRPRTSTCHLRPRQEPALASSKSAVDLTSKYAQLPYCFAQNSSECPVMLARSALISS